MIAVLTNHVWQSTLVAVVAWALVSVFRRSQARVRYAIWAAASLKFLIPFTLFVWVGAWVQTSPISVPGDRAVFGPSVVDVGQTFVHDWSPLAAPVAPNETMRPGLVSLLGVWAVGSLIVGWLRWRAWQPVRALVRASRRLHLRGIAVPRGVEVRCAPGVFEPAVVGCWRPILLMPTDIEDHLTRPQLQAVVAHELCHIRRRDNVTAMLHMMVEAAFWFHPLVWRIGASLVEERERACDEDVLQRLGNPQAYAEAIVRVCRRYVEMPIACAPGVGGANLRARIEAIADNRIGRRLGITGRGVLVAALALLVAVPMMNGALAAAAQVISTAGAHAISISTDGPAFEVASIRPSPSEAPARIGFRSGRMEATGATLRDLVLVAYGHETPLPADRVTGFAPWMETQRYDIIASLERNSATPLEDFPLSTLGAVRRLLTERFRLTVRTEPREVPVFALVLAKPNAGTPPALQPTALDCEAIAKAGPFAAGPGPCARMRILGGPTMRMDAQGVTMVQLADRLSSMPVVGRPVVEGTGLAGAYDFRLDWAPPVTSAGVTPDTGSIFTALQEQLGLRLDPSRGRVDMLVIEHGERPTPN